MDPLKIDTVRLSEAGDALVIIDQTLLPNEVRYLRLRETEDICEAIRMLRVRGAPAIGVAAAFGAYLAARFAPDEQLEGSFLAACDALAASRPTAVNLFWALDRMRRAYAAVRGGEPGEMRRALRREAQAIMDEDIEISRSIGRCGLELLRPGMGILTHCNAGTLATAKYGTALAPVYAALEAGLEGLRVYCDETRPLLQGARLSAFEMVSAGVDTTLLCDNMASSLMKSGKVDIIFVGCDRVARNGDAANKIGTSGVAILAAHYGIPFYVCAPSSTIDPAIASGAEIPIEFRDGSEVTELWYAKRMAPEGVGVYNPAFDVTEAGLITGIITERGMVRAPFEAGFRELGLLG
ncbi:MAG: S-methyl-5-thioribose-1-phosphate isomerase [Oscillospiraceae bacterium]